MKIGIIGAGRIAYVHAKSITYHIPDTTISCIADPYLSDAAKKWSAELGIKKAVTDPAEIFADPEIDAVLICSSTDTHAEYVIKAANAGKHIFCEKPVDMDSKRIRETLSVVEKAGVKFFVGFNRRFDHNFMALREAVENGSVGEPHIIRVTSRDPGAPPISYVKVSGGLFLDMMIHDLDMVRYLAGSEVEEVYARGAVLVDPAIGEAGDVDTAVVTLKFKNGALGIIENSREAAYGYDQRAEVFGSKGAARIENDKPSTVQLSTVSGENKEKPLHFFLERYMDAYVREMKLFIDAIQNDTPVAAGGIDGLYAVLLAEAAKKSMLSNQPVKLEY